MLKELTTLTNEAVDVAMYTFANVSAITESSMQALTTTLSEVANTASQIDCS